MHGAHKGKGFLGLVLLALLLGLAGWAWASLDVSQKLYEAYSASQPAPHASRLVAGLDEAKAYQIQNRLVAKLLAAGDRAAGLKAGLTTRESQEKFQAPGPVGGVLMESMRITDGLVPLARYVSPMLEVEIGFILGQDVATPTNAEAVRDLVEGVAPAIEAPDAAFQDMKALTYLDLIAFDVSPRYFIIGRPISPRGLDLGRVAGQLFREGQPLSPPVPSSAAMGDQWQALAWTLNNALAQGQPVKKGMVVITGCLGPMHPGLPGAYKAVYTGGLGELSFSVK